MVVDAATVLVQQLGAARTAPLHERAQALTAATEQLTALTRKCDTEAARLSAMRIDLALGRTTPGAVEEQRHLVDALHGQATDLRAGIAAAAATTAPGAGASELDCDRLLHLSLALRTQNLNAQRWRVDNRQPPGGFKDQVGATRQALSALLKELPVGSKDLESAATAVAASTLSLTGLATP